MSSVIEYDSDSASRKFVSSYCMFDTGDFHFIDGLNSITEFFSDGKQIPGLPIYHLFRSGFYPTKTGWVGIIRGHKKTFKVGLNKEDYSIIKFNNGRWTPYKLSINNIKFNDPINKEEALLYDGALSRTIFTSDKTVWYLGKEIALRKGHEFWVCDVSLIQELKDVLRFVEYKGKPCQVKAL